MAAFNWGKLRSRDLMRRAGTEQVSRLKPLSKDEQKLLAYRDPGKAMLNRPRSILIKCYHCGHTGKIVAKGSKSLPRFRCSVCGHKGYPQKRINQQW